MSRETLMEMVDDIKSSLTSEQYKKLAEEIAKVQPIGKHLELKIMYPVCRPVGSHSCIRTYSTFSNLSINLDQHMLSEDDWNFWISYKSSTLHVNHLMNHIPEESRGLIQKLLVNPYDARHTITFTNKEEDEYEDEDEDEEDPLIRIDVISHVEQVHVTVTETGSK